jgi:DDE superfamily endonuclease
MSFCSQANIIQLSKAAAERNEASRTVFQLEIGAEPPERLVYTDESAIDLRTTYRLMGWNYKGCRARSKAKFVRGQRYAFAITSVTLHSLYFRFSLLPALSQEGIIYSDIRMGSYDGDSFLEYLEGLLEHMNPYPAPRSVLVLDNCGIHHVPGVRELCAERCV